MFPLARVRETTFWARIVPGWLRSALTCESADLRTTRLCIAPEVLGPVVGWFPEVVSRILRLEAGSSVLVRVGRPSAFASQPVICCSSALLERPNYGFGPRSVPQAALGCVDAGCVNLSELPR